MATDSSTAAIIIIGDEILKGQVLDTNSNFLVKKLYTLGVKVKKISVVQDDIDEIASEVSEFSKKYTHVLTAGGIGPTHDDLSYQGISKGLGQPLVLLPGLVEAIQAHFPVEIQDYDPLNLKKFDPTEDFSHLDPALKMALVPASSQLHFLRREDGSLVSKIPLVQAENVVIFPGIPQFLQRGAALLDSICQNGSGRQFYTRVIYLKKDEWNIAPVLNAAVAKFAGQVTFGSYPVVDNSCYFTRLTMESTDQLRADEAYHHLVNRLPTDSIVLHPNASSHRCINEIINGSEEHPLKQPLLLSCKVIEECLTRYRPSEVCVSFNGGKDCSALLHMIDAVRKRLHPDSNERLQAMYIRGADPFPEMERFIEDTQKRYDMDLWTVAGPIRTGLTTVMEQHPDVKAVLMGTRRSDPHAANLQAFQMTDPGWPSLMRVSPILDWSYQQVWTFLRCLDLPYCCLYDKGYTSIGNRGNTRPNPALCFVGDDGVEVYRPAYLLHDVGGTIERQGRL